eukprot:gene7601-17172_t
MDANASDPLGLTRGSSDLMMENRSREFEDGVEFQSSFASVSSPLDLGGGPNLGVSIKMDSPGPSVDPSSSDLSLDSSLNSTPATR